MSPASQNLAVLFGGPSPEHDVSILTGLLAARELLRGGASVRAIYWSKNGSFVEVDPSLEAEAFVEGAPRSATPLELQLGSEGGFLPPKGRFGGRQERLAIDALVVCCHGGPGEDGSLQGALDLAGLAYTGPSAMGAALGMDKLASGDVLGAGGIPVLERLALFDGGSQPSAPGPYIVKPRFGGSSIGIDVVADLATALHRLTTNVHLRRGAVIEPYREDLFDLQIAVRSWPAIELSAIERPVRRRVEAEILDYTDKYVGGEGMHSAPRELPAQIPDALAARIHELALRCAVLLQIRGIARIDFLSDGRDELYLNEVNTVPGSLSNYLFVDPRRSFGELLAGLVDEALRSPAAVFSSAGADGTVLRAASSIAAKLG